MAGQNQTHGLPTCTPIQASVLAGSKEINLSHPAIGASLTERLVDNCGDDLWIERGFGADNSTATCVNPRDQFCITQLRRAPFQQAPATLWISVDKSSSFHHLSTTFQGQSTTS
ncbi:MAG: hypothetical protein ACI9C2_000920 [Gammaproteobacteria bacterium]|jgi:hypothetical protein